jgi:hypothetical protein
MCYIKVKPWGEKPNKFSYEGRGSYVKNYGGIYQSYCEMKDKL